MTAPDTHLASGAPRWMLAFSAIVFICVVGYYGFLGLDSFGLADRRGTATVIGKEYLPPGTSYRTVIISGQPRAVPYATGEQFLLSLRVSGDETLFPADRDDFHRLNDGDRIPVVYRKARLTGSLQVVDLGR